jgi:hypothetical protein
VAGNQVTLTFAGDSVAVERTMTRVGQGASAMAQDVGRASATMTTSLGTTESAFDSIGRASGRLGESLDTASGAFSQLSGGVGDIGGAMTAFTDMQDASAAAADNQSAAQLNVEKAQKDLTAATKEFGAGSIEAREAQLALNQAQRDAEPPSKIQEWGEKMELVSPIIMGVVGATDLLMLANTTLHGSFVTSTVSMIASKVAMGASAVATGVWTGAQWLLNTALSASPLALIVIGIVALVAAIAWIAAKTTWFQTIWEISWNAVRGVFQWVMGTVIGGWDSVWSAGRSMVDKISGIPNSLRSVFSGVASIISSPFRAAFNSVADAWNGTIGRLSWSVPGWVPQIGGQSISAPRLPHFHTGGVVPGPPGSEMMAVLQAGERVTPASGGSQVQVVIRSDGTHAGELLLRLLQDSIGVQGGDVQSAAGGTW